MGNKNSINRIHIENKATIEEGNLNDIEFYKKIELLYKARIEYISPHLDDALTYDIEIDKVNSHIEVIDKKMQD